MKPRLFTLSALSGAAAWLAHARGLADLAAMLLALGFAHVPGPVRPR